MKAARIMTREVTCVSPKMPLATAGALMSHLQVRHLPVTLDGKLVGVLSDRDLLRRGQRGEGGEVVFPAVSCGEVMTTRPVACIGKTPVSRLAALMLEHHIDCVPIVTADNRLVGIVTSADLLELLTEPEQGAQVLPFDFTLSEVDEGGELVSARGR